MLKGVVPDEINERTCAWIDGDIPANPSYIPDGLTEADLDRIRFTHEPTSIFLEDWFIEHVLLNPQLAGAMRSLLGPNVGLPILASHHRAECPMEAQGWHQDADHIYGPELRFLEVFYFPQDTPVEMGPTELVPGSHIQPGNRDREEGGVFCDGPAGTIGIHHQSIMHRRGKSTAKGLRRMLKYNYCARHLLSAIGSSRKTLISRGRITAGTARRATMPICFIGSAARGISSASSAARPGLGSPKTRSDRRMVLTPRKAISQLAAGQSGWVCALIGWMGGVGNGERKRREALLLIR